MSGRCEAGSRGRAKVERKQKRTEQSGDGEFGGGAEGSADVTRRGHWLCLLGASRRRAAEWGES